jgi:hypothetical protein
MNRRTIGLALAVALACPGCFASYGFGVGPTLDTNLDLGVQVSLRAEIGIPLGDENALAEVIRVDGAPPGLVTPHVTPVVGFDYFHLLPDEEIAFRVGLRARFQMSWDDTFHAWIGAGGSFAVLPELESYDNDSDEHTLLGFELEGSYMDDSAAEVAEGEDPPRIGFFSLMLVWEQVIMDEDPWGGDW